MATTITPGRREPPSTFGGGNGDWRPSGRSPKNNTLGVYFGLAAIGMLFIALTSSYVVRQGLGSDWQRLPMPRVLLVSTAVLLLSSLTIEKARSTLRRGNQQAANTWTLITLALGLAFLTGQVAAWRSLAQHGYFVDTNPHSSFFYVLVGLHAIHLAGGIIALAYISTGAVTELIGPVGSEFSAFMNHFPRARKQRWLEGTAVYWHFMDALWIYLLCLLFIWS